MLFFITFYLALSEKCTEDSLQSPIDIVSPFTFKDPQISFYLGYQEKTLLYHDGSTLRIDGDFGGFLWNSSYFWSTGLVFKQPSEHTLEGSTMPMEMQVFFTDQYSNQAALVAFFEKSSESNFLFEVGFGNPQLKDAEEGSLFFIEEAVDISSLLGYPKYYLYYEGSTTVSPCVTNVTWIILTNTYKASEEQLNNFPTSLQGEVRETQELNDRKIYCNFKTSSNGEILAEDEGDNEGVVQAISMGKSYKEVNDEFIVETEVYLNEFPEVENIY